MDCFGSVGKDVDTDVSVAVMRYEKQCGLQKGEPAGYRVAHRQYSSHGSVDALGGRCDGLQGHRIYKGQKVTHEKSHFDRWRDQGKRPMIDGVDLVIDLPSIH